MKKCGLCLFILLLVIGRITFAQINREQVRKIVDTYQNAVVKIKVIIKQWDVFQGTESLKHETKYEITGTIIDKNGTIVIPAFTLDPSKIFQQMFGEESGFQMKTELKEVKIILPDNKEIEGKVVLKDDKWDLAFLRPKSPPQDVQFNYIDLDNTSEPQLLDEVISIWKIEESVNRAIFVSLSRIGGIITEPRVYYLVMDSFEPGSPVFSPDGKLIGLNTLRIISREGSVPRSFAEMMEGKSPFLEVILPAKVLKERIGQIKK